MLFFFRLVWPTLVNILLNQQRILFQAATPCQKICCHKAVNCKTKKGITDCFNIPFLFCSVVHEQKLYKENYKPTHTCMVLYAISDLFKNQPAGTVVPAGVADLGLN